MKVYLKERIYDNIDNKQYKVEVKYKLTKW